VERNKDSLTAKKTPEENRTFDHFVSTFNYPDISLVFGGKIAV